MRVPSKYLYLSSRVHEFTPQQALQCTPLRGGSQTAITRGRSSHVSLTQLIIITTDFWVNKINFLNSSPTSLLSLSLITCIMRFTRYKCYGMYHTYSFPSLPSRSIYKRKCSVYIFNLQQTENFNSDVFF